MKNIYDKRIYINDSLCPQFHYIGYVVRKLKKKAMIAGYKVRNGIFSVQFRADDLVYTQITHKSDFEMFNLDAATALVE